MNMVERLRDNLANVRQRISDAAARSGRRPDSVLLVAVTKYVDARVTRSLYESGCTEIGESRPQELWRKAEQLSALPIHWHLIGHLQRNKVRRTLDRLTLLHSGDSYRLLSEIQRVAREIRQVVPLLLEVNISGDATKHGFAAGEVEPLLGEFAGWDHLRVRGLMAMAGRDSDAPAARADFARLRELRDTLQANCPAGIALEELSMGMSHDFEVAIEEGATIVRVGSALFEGIEG